MTEDIIKKLIDEPYVEQIYSYEIDKFIIEGSFRSTQDYICGEIKCRLNNNRNACGTMDIDINLSEFKQKKIVIFKNLYVTTTIKRKGIGRMLMHHMFDVIKTFKKFYSVDEKVLVIGWLSMVDKVNGNWKVSVPFYEKIGNENNVESYFIIGNNEQKISAIEFLENANSDGHIHYLV